MEKLIKSNEEWRSILTPLQFKILREKGTEISGYSKLNSNKEKGLYYCVACSNLLFSSEAKYDSGTGWPSFTNAENDFSVIYDPDRVSQGAEALCWRCEGHLGHVFNDGPKPLGLRFCMNGEVLKFVADEK